MQNQKPVLLSLGEVLVDLIAVDHTCSAFTAHFGGSSGNVAINLANLGHKIAFAGCVGEDAFGAFIEGIFQRFSVDTRLLNTSVNYNTSLVVVDESKTPLKALYYKDADYHLVYSDELEQIINKVNFLHTSAHALAFEPLRNTVIKAIKYAKKRNKIISFEPNFRPDINNMDDEYLETVYKAMKYATIVKPSKDDADKLFPDETDCLKIIDRFRTFGVQQIILTLGAEGVYYLNDKHEISHKPAEKIAINEIKRLTGAGDAFWAGYLSKIIHKASREEAIISGIYEATQKIKYKRNVNILNLEQKY